MSARACASSINRVKDRTYKAWANSVAKARTPKKSHLAVALKVLERTSLETVFPVLASRARVMTVTAGDTNVVRQPTPAIHARVWPG